MTAGSVPIETAREVLDAIIGVLALPPVPEMTHEQLEHVAEARLRSLRASLEYRRDNLTDSDPYLDADWQLGALAERLREIRDEYPMQVPA